MLDGTTIEYLTPEELNSFSRRNILLFLPSNNNLSKWFPVTLVLSTAENNVAPNAVCMK
jgi:hypothetical protein